MTKEDKPLFDKPVFDKPLFDEGLVSGLILEWQKNGDERTFAAILAASEGLIDTLVWKLGNNGQIPDYEDRDDERQRIHIKLHHRLPGFDPAKGRAFSFLVAILSRHLIGKFRDKAGRLETRLLDRSLDADYLADCLANFPAVIPDPELTAAEREKREKLLAAFQVPDAREAFLKNYFLETGDFPPTDFYLRELGLAPSEKHSASSFIGNFRGRLRRFLRFWSWRFEWRWSKAGTLPGYPVTVPWQREWRWVRVRN